MNLFLYNIVYFESPSSPILAGDMFRVAVILAKTFPIISMLFLIFFLFLITRLFYFKTRKNQLEKL